MPNRCSVDITNEKNKQGLTHNERNINRKRVKQVFLNNATTLLNLWSWFTSVVALKKWIYLSCQRYLTERLMLRQQSGMRRIVSFTGGNFRVNWNKPVIKRHTDPSLVIITSPPQSSSATNNQDGVEAIWSHWIQTISTFSMYLEETMVLAMRWEVWFRSNSFVII